MRIGGTTYFNMLKTLVKPKNPPHHHNPASGPANGPANGGTPDAGAPTTGSPGPRPRGPDVTIQSSGVEANAGLRTLASSSASDGGSVAAGMTDLLHPSEPSDSASTDPLGVTLFGQLVLRDAAKHKAHHIHGDNADSSSSNGATTTPEHVAKLYSAVQTFKS